MGRDSVLYAHLTLVPFIGVSGELKTKPTQHSVKMLTSLGIQPDIIILRSEQPIDEPAKDKISLFCNVARNCVITAQDAASIYDVPLMLNREGLDDRVVECLNMWTRAPHLEPWQKVAKVMREPKHGEVLIAMVGKYVDLTESYKSLNEALTHGGLANDCRVSIVYIDAEQLGEEATRRELEKADAVLVPGGFGKRGSEGKIEAIRYAREGKVPFLGICLGLQMAVVEFARNVAGLSGAASSEFEPDAKQAVIHLMEEQKSVADKGATMRLGGYPCVVGKGTKTQSIYKRDTIIERHRHRWEVNNEYLSKLEAAGLVVAGRYEELSLVEIVEVKEHPWFIGVQFHPEFTSKPLTPHPLFKSFIAAAREFRDKRAQSSADAQNGASVSENTSAAASDSSHEPVARRVNE